MINANNNVFQLVTTSQGDFTLFLNSIIQVPDLNFTYNYIMYNFIVYFRRFWFQKS